MIDEAKLAYVMATALNVTPDHIRPETSQETLKAWDSLKHMNLVLALERAFGVEIPDEDVAEITSYALIKVVLQDLVDA